jgi:hypothetical protein
MYKIQRIRLAVRYDPYRVVRCQRVNPVRDEMPHSKTRRMAASKILVSCSSQLSRHVILSYSDFIIITSNVINVPGMRQSEIFPGSI